MAQHFKIFIAMQPPFSLSLGLLIGAIGTSVWAQAPKGPRTVPENSRYEYSAGCDADWTITSPGAPSTGKGHTLEVTWGSGPAAATIETRCANHKPQTLRVEVVQVTIDRTTIVLGGQAADGGVNSSGIQLVSTAGPPPALTITADIKLQGATPHWKSKLQVGFVQRLTTAAQSSWYGEYADNVKPKPHQKKLTADTTTDPPPKSDYDEKHSRSKAWYADDSKKVILERSENTLQAVTITMNDSPGPGWWHQDQKKNGNLLLKEAHAIWGFETYLCARGEDDPTRFFRRAIASWSIEVTFQTGQPAQVTGVVSPPGLAQMTASVSDDPGQCPTGGQSTNAWLNNTVTFK